MGPDERAPISLREVTESDIPVFFEHQLDPDALAMAAFSPRERDEHRAHWQRIIVEPTGVVRTIVVGEEVAGNLVSWIQDDHREIGYWVGKPYWGRGIATAALREFVQIVVDRPLFAYVAEHNTGSIRVLEKAGFVAAGREESHLIYKLH